MTGKVTKGLQWNGISQMVTQFTVIIGSIMLARILSPEDFGTVAMVTVISSFASLFLDMGFSTALVQKSNVDDGDLSSVFWLNLGIGIICSILIISLSSSIVNYYNNELLYQVIYCISPVFILGALQQMPRIILTRKMDFKSLGLMNIIAVPLSYIAAITAAKNGIGLWSIVIQILASNIIVCVIGWSVVKWRPLIIFNLNSIRSISNFSLFTFFNGFLEYWSQNLSSFLIGRQIGSIDLGIFSRSTAFILLPVRNISQVIATTVFPKLSNIKQETSNLRTYFLLLSRFQFFIVFPAMLGLFSIADVLIPALFGDAWVRMIPLVKIFAFIGLFSVNFKLNDITISSQGRADLLFKFGLFEKSIIVASIIIGIQYGIIGLAYSRLAGVIITSFSKYYLFYKVMAITPLGHLLNFKKIIFSGLTMLGAISLLDLITFDLSLLSFMIFKIIVGMIIFFGMSYLLNDDIFHLFKEKLKLSFVKK